MQVSAVEGATEIVRQLKNAGYIAYFAGGFTRDYLRGVPCQDIDIATDAPVDVIQSLFPQNVAVGAAFGVIVVLWKGFSYEVATFRRDLAYKDGRHPEKIERASPQEDAQRRDFTINGMFFDPLENKIYDYVGGQEDLKCYRLRTIGEPKERFEEDRLRLLRAVRFAITLGFTIEETTKEAIKAFAHTLFPAVAVERVWQELSKMALSERFCEGLKLLEEVGLLKILFPYAELAQMADIQKLPKDCPLILLILQLFPKASLKQDLALCELYKLSNVDKDLVINYFKAKDFFSQDNPSRMQWTHFWAIPHAELYLNIVAPSHVKQAHAQKRLLQSHIDRLVQKKPLLTSQHLFRAGITAGKQMGYLLQEGESLTIEHDLKTPEEALKLLRKTGKM